MDVDGPSRANLLAQKLVLFTLEAKGCPEDVVVAGGVYAVGFRRTMDDVGECCGFLERVQKLVVVLAF